MEASDAAGGSDEVTDGEPTAVVAVPAYDASARRGSSFSSPSPAGVVTTSSMASPGAMAWTGGHQPYVVRRGGGESVRLRTVVAGVFIGMWLFVVSVFVLAVVLGRATIDSLPSTSTSTVPTVPVPTSLP